MSDIERNNGRFAPGNKGGPGRPPKATEQQMLDAITEAISPDELRSIIQEAIQIARSTQSARGLLAVAEFVADRTLGRPQVKIQSTTTKFEEMLAKLGSNEPVEDTDATGSK